jgi:hypothetical protein
VYVQTLVHLQCHHHFCSWIYHLEICVSQLLKLEHFPFTCTKFHPYNQKHRSFAGLIDIFKSCVCLFNSACVVMWASSELGSTYWCHNSYCRHPVRCHLNHPPGSMTGVSGAHNFLLCGMGLKVDGKLVCSISFFNVCPGT